MNSFKGRTIKVGERYNVYRNLKKGLFSVQELKTSDIVAHGENFQLSEVKFHFTEGGKRGVIESKVRNVHAKAQGKFIGLGGTREGKREISYNPFIEKGFYYVDTGEEVIYVENLYVEKNKIFGS